MEFGCVISVILVVMLIFIEEREGKTTSYKTNTESFGSNITTTIYYFNSDGPSYEFVIPRNRPAHRDHMIKWIEENSHNYETTPLRYEDHLKDIPPPALKRFKSTSRYTENGQIMTTMWYYNSKGPNFMFTVPGPLPAPRNEMINWLEVNSYTHTVTNIPYEAPDTLVRRDPSWRGHIFFIGNCMDQRQDQDNDKVGSVSTLPSPVKPPSIPPPTPAHPSQRPSNPPPTTKHPWESPTNPPQTTAQPWQRPTIPTPATVHPWINPTNPPPTTVRPRQRPTNPPPTTEHPWQSPSNPPPTTVHPWINPTNPPLTTVRPRQRPTNPPPTTEHPWQSPTNPPPTTVHPWQSPTNPPPAPASSSQSAEEPPIWQPATVEEILPTLCGVAGPVFGGKVTDGVAANIEDNPWQVALLDVSTLKPTCGGSIIASRIVITAAHCFHRQNLPIGDPNKIIDKRKRVVFPGHTDLDQVSLQDTYKIDSLFIHKAFQTTHWRNDIAMLVVSTEFNFNLGTMFPICLPSYETQYFPRSGCTISGWGKIAQDAKHSEKRLRSATVSITSLYECTLYNQKYINMTGGMFCGGDFNLGKVDTCQGDSGGPFACTVDGSAYLYGITSFGHGCGQIHYPGVYTRVGKYYPWIMNRLAVLTILDINLKSSSDEEEDDFDDPAIQEFDDSLLEDPERDIT